MSEVGFEPTLPMFERAKMIDDLDCEAAMIGVPEMPELQIFP
jgi:hypothetical protein